MKYHFITIVILLFYPFNQSHAGIILPALLSDNMVVQQNAEVAFWGKSNASETVRITTSWNNQTNTVVADQYGRWKTKITTPVADAIPHSVEFKDESNDVILLNNVLLGDVWLCSGQSNMVVPVRNADNAAVEMNDADYPLIRLFKVPVNTSLTPVDDVVASWEVTGSHNVSNFPAIAFFYARQLFKHTQVPVGIVHSAYGSSTQEAWLSEENIAGVEYAEKVLSDAREDLLVPGFVRQKIPTVLYHAMFKPLVPYTFRGLCWYQGEGNSMNPIEYPVLLKRFITSWRNELEQPELPFFIIQLSGYKSPNTTGWPMVQEQQYKVSKELPHVSTVITYDLGDPDDIHPKNKQDVAYRLFLAARKKVYKENIVAQGPVFENYTVEGNKVLVSFANTGSGIVLKNGGDKINNFMMAGSDRLFYQADATLQQNGIVKLVCDQVPEPKFIRYAFAAYNNDVNFYNGEGLPAVPFRTDKSISSVAVSAKSGAWTDPATWEDEYVPTKDNDVVINSGHAVSYFIDSSSAIAVDLCRNLKIDGTLRLSNLKSANFTTNVFGSVHCDGEIVFGQTGNAVSGAILTLKGNSVNISGSGVASLKTINLNVNSTNSVISLPLINCTNGVNISATGSKMTVAAGTTISSPVSLSVAQNSGQGTGVNSLDIYGSITCGTVFLCNNSSSSEKSSITIKDGGVLNVTNAFTPLRGAGVQGVVNTIGGSGLVLSVEQNGSINWTSSVDNPISFTNVSNSLYDPNLEIVFKQGSLVNGKLINDEQKGGGATSVHSQKAQDVVISYSLLDNSVNLFSHDYKRITVYNVSGNLIFDMKSPGTKVLLPKTDKGIYIVVVVDNTGQYLMSKISMC